MEENQYKNSNFIERLQCFMEKKGVNDNQMTVNAGLSVGLIGKAKVSGKGMSSMNIEKILLAYPELSADWLLTGVGEMIKKDSNDVQAQLEQPVEDYTKTVQQVPEGSLEGIPLIPLSAMAGAFSGESFVMEYECERYVIPAFKGADFLIQIKGDSMQPTYYSGDLVACQRMPLNDIFFQWNKAYVLDTIQGPLIKRIMPGSDADHILIVSDNNSYPPFELHKDQFNGVALVRGLVRLE